jgi:predicted ATPase
MRPAVECDMAGFSDLSVRGYRRLNDVTLALRPLNVLVGANGIGKSSVLDVFRLLGMSADRRLAAAVIDAGGLQSILTADGKTSELEFEVKFRQTDGVVVTYELALTERGALPRLAIPRERLSKHDPTK